MEICKDVQVGGRVDVQIGSLRRQLRDYLTRPDAVLVRRHHDAVAILVPLKVDHWYQEKARRAALSRARRAFAEALASLDR